jgi:hypothetical protein
VVLVVSCREYVDLVPFLALQMYWPPLIWGGALWAITFPAATWLLAVHFGRIKELP